MNGMIFTLSVADSKCVQTGKRGHGGDNLPMPVAQRLVEVSRELSKARTLEQIQAVVRRAARELTAADGVTFVIRDGDHCVYADEDAIAPLWKGRRFVLSECISGWSMLNGAAAMIEDVYADDRIPREVYRPTFVKSLVMMPIGRRQPVGAIGVYWGERHRASPGEVETLRALADGTAVAMQRTHTQVPRTPATARSAMAGERCRNLYGFIRLRLGPELSDRELARRWGMNWRSFLNLKEGSRRVPRLEELETLAELLGVDPALVILVARGEPADVVNRWLLDGDHAIRQGLLTRLGLSDSSTATPLLHSRIDRIPGGLVTLDLRGCLRDWNARLASFVGEPERLGTGAHFMSFVAPGSAGAFLKLQAQALEYGEAGPETVRLARGETVDVRLVSIEDADGQTVGLQGLLQPHR